jgi:uncharacterized OB-fold protein
MAKLPLVSYLSLDEKPHLIGTVCDACGAIYLDRRVACGRCGAVAFSQRPLGETGALRTFTVIHRAAPGVQVPYTSVVVDLDGGGVVKANLRGPHAAAGLRAGARVRLTTYDVATDAAGDVAVAFAFELDPQKEGALHV